MTDDFRHGSRYVGHVSDPRDGRCEREDTEPQEGAPRLYLQDADMTLYQGEALETLRQLPAGSVHCVVTSPPYWGLRDYGTASWEGGESGCDHVSGKDRNDSGIRHSPGGGPFPGSTEAQFRDVCGKCGARRVDQALGLEATPELYVERMVEVFREVRRVLRSDGVCWVNLGDSYATNFFSHDSIRNVAQPMGDWSKEGQRLPKEERTRRGAADSLGGLKTKDLCGIPWRVAFALQADGWYLRSDVIWSKPNPMPESVTDRPTKAHEYVFLLTKSARYFFDQEAVRETTGTELSWAEWDERRKKWPTSNKNDDGVLTGNSGDVKPDGGRSHPNGRNVRSVWEIATQPYPEAHFATYPEELVRRCILAGCPEGGTVLDPFGGSGTTALVARKHGRRSILIELSSAYCGLAARRLQQLSLLSEVQVG